ncbi:glycosyltransferase family 4 protein [Xanthovirga aplysinae]|uniref:glycosyltransferase family 4 protein n=1 Tax=Xanthovirga aplysinae TaxID=2529853 RepID=UPI0012BC3877|nr:glycosyltransferase family 4 protein [Xanthovirga aplysinae]MTI31881.1 glycosyltransferase [Xanthovirga aplysinae]
MKILMISRATLFSSPGGDTTQVVETARHLRVLGVEVDIKLSDQRIAYKKYDLLHFFNIDRPNDILLHMRRSKKPFVVSTVFVDYGELERYFRKGFLRLCTKVFSPDQLEYLKVLARAFLNGEKLRSLEYFFRGHRSSVQQVVRKTAMLLPNSKSEYQRLVDSYKESQRYKIIPNAIRKELFGQAPPNYKKEGLLCVGRIESRKNQLNLIRAVKKTKYKLKLVGIPAPNHIEYFNSCKREANEQIEFLGRISEEDLLKEYQAAKVHILASWFETTGLSSLEAAAQGCQLVISRKGDTEEYFQGDAFYCEPDDVNSIAKAIEEAYKEPFNNCLRSRIMKEYTWEITAKMTLEAYQQVLREQE